MGASSDRSVVAVPGPLPSPSRPLNQYDADGSLKSTSTQRQSTARQRVRARARRQLAGIDRHRQHGVVPDASGELDEATVSKALAKRLNGCIVHAVLPKQSPSEIDDLRVLSGNAAGVSIADCADR